MQFQLVSRDTVQLLSLVTSLAFFWLLLSGHTEALILGFGVASCALVAWLCHRMDIVDHESHPHHLWPKMPAYWLHLTRDTLLSNWAVAKLLLSRRPAVPVTGYVDTPLQQDITRATLANSITLTPGTLTLDVEDERMLVHALTPELMDELREGKMIPRAVSLED